MSAILPNPPGSPEAVALGCICPVLDNGHGKGCGMKDDQGNILFWYRSDCPIHSEAEPYVPPKDGL